jgi:hypothetical protein
MSVANVRKDETMAMYITNDDEFVYVSEQLLLLLIYALLPPPLVGGVKLDEITSLHDNPRKFENIFQRMSNGSKEDHSDGFGNITIEVNGTTKTLSECLCFYSDSNDNPLRTSFANMCIIMANCIWLNEYDTGRYTKLASHKVYESPILFLCDVLMNRREKFKNKLYHCLGQTPDGSKILGYTVIQLFKCVEFDGDIPLLDSLPSRIQTEIQSRLKRLDELRGIGTEKAKAVSEPEIVKAVSKPETAKAASKHKTVGEALGGLSSSPTLVERVIGHIACFTCFVGCGILSFTAFNAAFNFTISALMLSNLSYGVNLAIGSISGLFTIGFGILTLFRILCSDAYQRKLRGDMVDAESSIGKFCYRALGAHDSELDLNEHARQVLLQSGGGSW